MFETVLVVSSSSKRRSTYTLFYFYYVENHLPVDNQIFGGSNLGTVAIIPASEDVPISNFSFELSLALHTIGESHVISYMKYNLIQGLVEQDVFFCPCLNLTHLLFLYRVKKISISCWLLKLRQTMCKLNIVSLSRVSPHSAKTCTAEELLKSLKLVFSFSVKPVRPLT